LAIVRPILLNTQPGNISEHQQEKDVITVRAVLRFGIVDKSLGARLRRLTNQKGEFRDPATHLDRSALIITLYDP
jgi:hypothetical protein